MRKTYLFLAFGIFKILNVYSQTTTSIIKDGNILKNGKPIFQFGCYGLFYSNTQADKVKSIIEMSKAGMNVTYMVNADNNPGLTNFLNLLDTCSKYNIDVVMGASNNSFLKFRIAQCKNKPATLGYTLADDADDGVKATLDECKTFEIDAKIADPNKVTHLTLTGWNNTRRSKAADFIAISDFCSYQIYPICQHRYADFSSTNALSETYKRTLAYVLEAEKVNKPFVMLPQTFSWGSQSDAPCYPKVNELRNMVYAGLASGVKGIVSYDFSFDLINNQKALWKEYSDLAKDVKKTEKYLLNQKVNRLSTNDPDLVISTWTDADTTLMMIINTSFSKEIYLQRTLAKSYSKPQINAIADRNVMIPNINGNILTGKLKATEVMYFKLYDGMITDIDRSEKEEITNFYPNPNAGTLNIENAAIGSELIISDLSGKTMLKLLIESTNQSIDVGILNKGVYLAKIGSVTKKITIL